MPRVSIRCRLGFTSEHGFTIFHHDVPVGRLEEAHSSEQTDAVQPIRLYHPRSINHGFERLGLQGIQRFPFSRLATDQFVAPSEIVEHGVRYSVLGLNFRSVHDYPVFTFEKEPVFQALTATHARSVVYLGYYLPDDTTTVSALRDALNAMGITHALLTFITCPSASAPISLNYCMTNDFFNLSPSNQAILLDSTNTFEIGVSFGGAFSMPSPLNDMFAPTAYYGGAEGLQKLAIDLAWACSPPVCSTYPCSFVYTVEAGDTCATITEKFGITTQQLIDANAGMACNGQTLPTTKPYTVQSGDYCYKIAQDAGITLTELLALNPGLDCNALSVGQVVNIPNTLNIPGSAESQCTAYIVKGGDTCATIATAHGVSLHDLFCANPGLQCNNLQVSQSVQIPAGTIPFPPTPPSDGPLFKYIDLDFENIVAQTVAQAQEFVDNVGQLCQNLRQVGFTTISHAPQPPYFTPSYQNLYLTLYQQYKTTFDFYNVQYYNNGPSDTFEEIFVASNASCPNTSVLELQRAGIDPSYIVVGKPSEPAQGTAGGYIPLSTLTQIFQEAYQTPSLSAWCAQGGAMIYYYSTTSIPLPFSVKSNLDPYYSITYVGDSPGMDQNVQTFFTTINNSPCQ